MVWRSMPEGAVGAAIPMIVIEDGIDVVALFQPSGTTCKARSGVRGGPRGRSMLGWHGSHEDRVWDGPDSIRVHIPGSGFEVIRSWVGGEFHGWYVNLVSPWTRTRLGFDTRDLILDLVAADDLSTWRWKDEDELRFAVEEGRIPPADEAAIRAEGIRAAELMGSRRFPFDEGWNRFRPDAGWPIPVLPAGWSAISPAVSGRNRPASLTREEAPDFDLPGDQPSV